MNSIIQHITKASVFLFLVTQSLAKKLFIGGGEKKKKDFFYYLFSLPGILSNKAVFIMLHSSTLTLSYVRVTTLFWYTVFCNLLTAITSCVATLISASSKVHMTIEYHVKQTRTISEELIIHVWFSVCI